MPLAPTTPPCSSQDILHSIKSGNLFLRKDVPQDVVEDCHDSLRSAVSPFDCEKHSFWECVFLDLKLVFGENLSEKRENSSRIEPMRDEESLAVPMCAYNLQSHQLAGLGNGCIVVCKLPTCVSEFLDGPNRLHKKVLIGELQRSALKEKPVKPLASSKIFNVLIFL